MRIMRSEIRLTNDDGYGAHIVITDPGQPLVFCFDNMASSKPDLSRDGWGVKFVTNRGLNVVSFLESKGSRRYSRPSFQCLIDDVELILKKWSFPRRIGYATSMGAYVSLALAERLRLDTVACISPYSWKNTQGDNRYDRFVNRDCHEWAEPWSSNVLDYLKKIRILLMLDPLKEFDALHARSIPSKWYRIPGMGHALEYWALPLKVVPHFFEDAVSDINGATRDRRFRQLARARRNTARYYTWLLSDENVHRTAARDAIIATKGIRLLMAPNSPIATAEIDGMKNNIRISIGDDLYNRIVSVESSGSRS